MNFDFHFKTFISIAILVLVPLLGWTQLPVSKLNSLRQLNSPPKKTNYASYLKKSNNELQGTGAVLFVAYKNFFSSQDMASCVFSPSCSVYAIEAFQSDNPFVAYVKVFDRLSRCHPLSAKGEYPYYKKTAQLYDPVH